MNISERFDLHGRAVLITGGSGVLGRVMASGLAQAGARVAVLGRREDPALAVAATIRSAGGEAIGVAADVLDRTALERANETITATLGPVDILVNGAGGNSPQATTGNDRSYFHLEMTAMRHVFDANVTGAIACSQIFGRVKAERRQGCIINVASMAGLRPLTRVVTYGTAQAALGRRSSTTRQRAAWASQQTCWVPCSGWSIPPRPLSRASSSRWMGASPSVTVHRREE